MGANPPICGSQDKERCSVGTEASPGPAGPPAERIYEWDIAQVGDTSPPYVYEVTAENIADYCRAVRYENPIYVNDGAAREMGFPGIFAPPTMLYTYAPQRRLDVMSARDYIAPEQSAGSPRSTPFVSTNIRFQGVLVRPDDVITSATTVVDKFERRGNKFITFRVTAHNQRQEKVAEYDYTCLWETRTRRLPQERPSPEQSQGSED
jgi:acyl dehydratase